MGCHLCEDMLDALALFRNELQYSIEVNDIDDDADLFEQFNTLVPVVYFRGREVMRYFFELGSLKQALLAGGTSGGE